MRKTCLAISFAILLTGLATAQSAVVATFSNSYMVDQVAALAIGAPAPIQATAITDAKVFMNLQAFPVSGGTPVLMLIDRGANAGSTIVVNAWSMFNLQLDLRDKGANGYGEQILFSGFEFPVAGVTTTNSGGAATATASIPACILNAGNATCITNPAFAQFEISSQAVVVDPLKPPFNLATTNAIQGTFDNGYKEFSLSGEDFGVFTFKQGFTFNYYGLNFTQAAVSANGFVSFGQTDTGFPNITVSSVRTGVRRIMSFYNDLVPEELNASGTGPAYLTTRIYAQQFKDCTGLTKVKFVHDHLAEFSNTTGPHGGEIIVTDNDDIAIFVPGYNGLPSINTVVGITPGNSIGPALAGNGPDLVSLSGTLTAGSMGGAIYEFYDYGPPTGVNNPMTIIGQFNNPSHPVGPGVVFLKNTAFLNTAPANSGYIIQ